MAMKGLGDFFIKIKPQFDDQAFKKGAQGVGNAAKSLAKGFVATTAAGATMLSMIKGQSQALVDMADSAAYAGTSLHTLEKWRKFMQLSGKDANTANQMFESLNATLGGMKFGEGPFQELGILGADFEKLKSSGNLAGEVINRLMQQDTSTRAHMAGKLGIDKSIIEALISPLAKETMKMAEQQAQTTADQVKSSREFNLKTEMMGSSWENLKKNVATQTMGTAGSVVDKLTALLNNEKAMANLSKMVDAILKLVGGIVSIADTLLGGKSFGEKAGIKDEATTQATMKEGFRQKQMSGVFGNFGKAIDKGTGGTGFAGAVLAPGRASISQGGSVVNKTTNVTINASGTDPKGVVDEAKRQIMLSNKETMLGNGMAGVN